MIIIRLGRFSHCSGARIWHCCAAKSGEIHGVRRRTRSPFIPRRCKRRRRRLGAGLCHSVCAPVRGAGARRGPALEVTCWVVIAPDDTVTIRVAHAEMGQGAMTGLAMLVAEELECDWAKVRTEFVSPARICGATRSGATPRPAPAARSRRRRLICAAPAPPRAKC